MATIKKEDAKTIKPGDVIFVPEHDYDYHEFERTRNKHEDTLEEQRQDDTY